MSKNATFRVRKTNAIITKDRPLAVAADARSAASTKRAGAAFRGVLGETPNKLFLKCNVKNTACVELKSAIRTGVKTA